MRAGGSMEGFGLDMTSGTTLAIRVASAFGGCMDDTGLALALTSGPALAMRATSGAGDAAAFSVLTTGGVDTSRLSSTACGVAIALCGVCCPLTPAWTICFCRLSASLSTVKPELSMLDCELFAPRCRTAFGRAFSLIRVVCGSSTFAFT